MNLSLLVTVHLALIFKAENNMAEGPRLNGNCISRRWEGGTVGSPWGVGEWGDYDPNTLTGIIK